MEILNKLEKDYTQAFKEKNELVLLVLRGIKTAITNLEIGKNREAITEDELIKLLRSEVKKRRESAQLYTNGNRPELAKKENDEIEIISQYLPAELNEDDVKKKINEVIAKMGEVTIKDMGKIVGLVMKDLGSAADGSMVSKLIKEALNK